MQGGLSITVSEVVNLVSPAHILAGYTLAINITENSKCVFILSMSFAEEIIQVLR